MVYPGDVTATDSAYSSLAIIFLLPLAENKWWLKTREKRYSIA